MRQTKKRSVAADCREAFLQKRPGKADGLLAVPPDKPAL